MKAIFQKETNSILVLDSYAYKSFLKLQAGAKWMPEFKGWSIPMSVELVEELQALKCTMAQEIQLAYYDKKKCLDQAKLQKFNDHVIAKEPMPIKAKAYDHQIRGYNIACEIMDLFN